MLAGGLLIWAKRQFAKAVWMAGTPNPAGLGFRSIRASGWPRPTARIAGRTRLPERCSKELRSDCRDRPAILAVDEVVRWRRIDLKRVIPGAQGLAIHLPMRDIHDCLAS